MPNDREHIQPKADRALDKLKYEVAEDLGLDDDIEQQGWGNMTTREVGKIGGNMTRRMVKYAENSMVDQNDTVEAMDDDEIAETDTSNEADTSDSIGSGETMTTREAAAIANRRVGGAAAQNRRRNGRSQR